jgi:cephalosporin-C deacetylase-like acetyl esterase
MNPHHRTRRRRVATLLAAVIALPTSVQAQDRTGVVRVQVTPDREDWTYAPGANVRFHVRVTRDGHPVPGASVTYAYGPEMLPPSVEKSAAVPPPGLTIDAGTLREPGFLRLVATAEVDGRKYRGLATAGFAPDRIRPTVEDPPDFDAFWTAGKDSLAKLPIEAKLTPLPDLSTPKVDVYHVSLQNVGTDGTGTSRFYGILAEPKAEGRFPGVLNVPGAGVRPYRGLVDLAEKGMITLQVGIHGLPVNLDTVVYDGLRAAGLSGYWAFNLDDRERYYYRRVYLGCVRANDFLASRPKWDGRNLVVTGGSQGGALSIVTAALDARVTGLAAYYPALSDTTGYVNGRAGGWPHLFKDETAHRTPAKLSTIRYYDIVNFARRVRVPGLYSWGYNDEVCPPTSMYAAYSVIPGPKQLLLALETGHFTVPEQTERVNRWIEALVGREPASK